MCLQEYESVEERCVGEVRQLDSMTIHGQEPGEQTSCAKAGYEVDDGTLRLLLRGCAESYGVRNSHGYCDDCGSAHDQVSENAVLEKHFEEAVD